MKAFLCDQYGDATVLQCKEIARPVPKNKEVLVKIHASSVSAGAIWMRKGEFPGSGLFTFFLRMQCGIFKPRNGILGVEFSGVVEQTGKDVRDFKIGDQVFGTTTGLKNGSYADYVCIPEHSKIGVMALIPNGMSFESAAALPVGGMTALQILNRARIRPGQKILIYGASGSVGTFAVQIARYQGAHVTAVCSGSNIDLVKSIGADEAIDYTVKTDSLSADQFDIVFDAVGKMPRAFINPLLGTSGKFYSINTITAEKQAYIHQLIKMTEEKKLEVVIDWVYPFVQLANAHAYVEAGHKKGNVVIRH